MLMLMMISLNLRLLSVFFSLSIECKRIWVNLFKFVVQKNVYGFVMLIPRRPLT